MKGEREGGRETEKKKKKKLMVKLCSSPVLKVMLFD